MSGARPFEGIISDMGAFPCTLMKNARSEAARHYRKQRGTERRREKRKNNKKLEKVVFCYVAGCACLAMVAVFLTLHNPTLECSTRSWYRFLHQLSASDRPSRPN